jgi:hypothetical protein
MSINHFFEKVLLAPVRNSRWSWGAEDTVNSWVFLRVWEDHIHDGEVEVGYELRKLGPAGFGERQKHIKKIIGGARGYGVVCIAKDKNTAGSRKIESFDEKNLLVFGGITKRNGESFATIIDKIPTERLNELRNSESVLVQDLIEIERQSIDETEKEALAMLRIGQGRFRDDLLEYWGYSCAVTGSKTLRAIRASHIQPWRNSSQKQRLDRENGLPLTAGLDALFDAGLISFDETGKMLISPELHADEHQFFAIHFGSLRRKPTKRMAEYLAYHRETIFKK